MTVIACTRARRSRAGTASRAFARSAVALGVSTIVLALGAPVAHAVTIAVQPITKTFTASGGEVIYNDGIVLGQLNVPLGGDFFVWARRR